ncbi:Exportin 4/7-like protein [Aduncisulcus paluster]|uniref:Exportin 4/7-like protein n=1 Tax=Aduncisulcus paluster TaxID=2918883 RepID=A0ABQ5KQD1_9EUKA|nr:Exportin 4/7-like protein [Aduncisulcus paluster]
MSQSVFERYEQLCRDIYDKDSAISNTASERLKEFEKPGPQVLDLLLHALEHSQDSYCILHTSKMLTKILKMINVTNETGRQALEVLRDKLFKTCAKRFPTVTDRLVRRVLINCVVNSIFPICQTHLIMAVKLNIKQFVAMMIKEIEKSPGSINTLFTMCVLSHMPEFMAEEPGSEDNVRVRRRLITWFRDHILPMLFAASVKCLFNLYYHIKFRGDAEKIKSAHILQSRQVYQFRVNNDGHMSSPSVVAETAHSTDPIATPPSLSFFPYDVSANVTLLYLEAILTLIFGCLNFTFTPYIVRSPRMSMMFEKTIDVPRSWETHITPLLVNTVKDLYIALDDKKKHAGLLLSILSCLSCIKPAVFKDNETKSMHFWSVAESYIKIMKEKAGIANISNYHKLCYGLSRFRGAVSTDLLCAFDPSDIFLTTVCDFTLESFQSYSYCHSSVHYLIKFWCDTSTHTTKYDSNVEKVQEMVKKVVDTFIKTHLRYVSSVYEGCGSEDPVEDAVNTPQTTQLLEFIPSLARSLTSVETALFDDLFSDRVKTLKRIIAASETVHDVRTGIPCVRISNKEFVNTLGKILAELSWVVSICAYIMKGRTTDHASRGVDSVVSGEVFSLIQAVSGGVVDCVSSDTPRIFHAHLNLEKSIIAFFGSFRRMYVMERSSNTDIYSQTRVLVNIKNIRDALEFMCTKCVAILRCYDNEELVRETVTFFNEMVSGYNSNRILPSLPIIRDMLKTHASTPFAFQSNPHLIHEGKVLYTAIARLALHPHNIIVVDNFFQFFAQIASKLPKVVESIEPPPESVSDGRGWSGFSAEIKQHVVPFLHNLTGVVEATNKNTFQFVLDFIFQMNILKYLNHLMDRGAYAEPDVGVAILELCVELLTARNTRLDFNIDNPLGFVLFKALASIVYTCSERLIRSGANLTGRTDAWDKLYNLVFLCQQIFIKAHSSKVCNFAAFSLFGDDILSNVLVSVLRLGALIPPNEIHSYVELSTSCISLFSIVATHSCEVVEKIGGKFTEHMLLLLREGLIHPTRTVGSTASACLELFFTGLAKAHLRKKAAEMKRMQRDVPNSLLLSVSGTSREIEQQESLVRAFGAVEGDVIKSIFRTLFANFLFDTKSTNRWPVSKALYPLIICLSGSAVEIIKQVVTENTSDDIRARALDGISAVIFRKLTFDNVSTTSLDEFFQNLVLFSKTLTELQNEAEDRLVKGMGVAGAEVSGEKSISPSFGGGEEEDDL